MPTYKGNLPLYLYSREIPNRDILDIVKEGINNKKGMNQIRKETRIPEPTVRRYYWQIRKGRWS